MERLSGYTWPGNVRELRNVIEYAMVLCATDLIDIQHLPVNIMRFFSKQVGEKGPRVQGVKGPSDCFQKHSVYVDLVLNTRYISRKCPWQLSNQQHQTAPVMSAKLSSANGVLRATAYVSSALPEEL